MKSKPDEDPPTAAERPAQFTFVGGGGINCAVGLELGPGAVVEMQDFSFVNTPRPFVAGDDFTLRGKGITVDNDEVSPTPVSPAPTKRRRQWTGVDLPGRKTSR